MQDFDIRAEIRAILDETNLTSPDEIADKVIDAIPREHVRAVLRLTLRSFVREEMTRFRSGLKDREPQPSRSAKVSAIRSAADRWLRERVNVHDGWKLLAECTYENLIFLVNHRLELVSSNQAAADRYQRLADLVKKHRAKTVADLPAKALAQLELADAA